MKMLVGNCKDVVWLALGLRENGGEEILGREGGGRGAGRGSERGRKGRERGKESCRAHTEQSCRQLPAY